MRSATGGTDSKCQSWGWGRGLRSEQVTKGDMGMSFPDGVSKRSKMFRHLGQERRSPSRGTRKGWRPAPLTSCLPPGSGLGGQASLAAASWVRKEEKSHIVWWLYPLGSLPETLATEQTVEPSGGRGRDLGPAYPAQMRQGSMEKGRGGR